MVISQGADRRTYSVSEAAAILGVSRDTIYSEVRQGSIPALQFGRRIVIPRAALQKLLLEVAP